MRVILYTVFVLSGAAGLFYEMVWSRYLALFLGHSAYAQVLVIAIFLGGMALGALLAGSGSHRRRDPLLWYVGAEFLVGLIGIFFHELYVAITDLAYGSIFPALAGTGTLTLFKWLLGAALILPQSILLGATFPLMAAGVLRRVGRQPGRTLALLYFANSLGAAIGVLIAGFYLVPLAGLPGTLVAAAMANLAAALIVYVVARRHRAAETLKVETTPDLAGPARQQPLALPQLVRLLLFVSFGTAVASFAYEIGWLRMLALVLGGATHSFELMLSAFILGLALGSFWLRRRIDSWDDPLRVLGGVQLAMGASALATLALYGASFYWTADLMRTFARTDSGYVGFTLARYGICLAIMFPASFCAGMTLPLITRTLLVSGAGERYIGGVYGYNTVGAILGVALAGLVFLPLVGLKGLIVGGAALDMSLGAVVLWLGSRHGQRARRLAYAAAAFTLVATLLGVGSGNFERSLLASGVYRHGTVDDPGELTTLYYRDGRTASVAVTRRDGFISIRTNGKADASLHASWLERCATDSAASVRGPLGGDASTQTLAPLITLAHRPDAAVAAVIGQGSGISSHVLLGSPRIERLVTVEIEPAMVTGSRELYPANRRVFDDPRSTIVIDDAKSYFAASPLKFDMVFSEPSNPWVSGIASLFTTEFYAHMRRYLTENGVFGQWLHLYEIDDGLVLSVLAAIHQNFQSYEVFLTAGGDMLVVAGKGPSLGRPDWSLFELPAIAEDLCRVLPLTPATMEATRLTHRAALAPLLDGWEHPNSDFYPLLDLGAERARYLQRSAVGFLSLPTAPFDITAAYSGRRSLPGTAGVPPLAGIARIQTLAVSASLRGDEQPDSSWITPQLRAARYRLSRWEARLESPRPPADWVAWLDNFREVERDLHAGTAGYVDEELYRDAAEFMDLHGAPRVVRDVVEFRHGLAAWDFPEAADAARRLFSGGTQRAVYIDASSLMAGGVIALLRVGSPTEAEKLYGTTMAELGPRANLLQSRLIGAYLELHGHGGTAAHIVTSR